VGGLRQRGMTAPFVLEGAMNGPMLLVYVKGGTLSGGLWTNLVPT